MRANARAVYECPVCREYGATPETFHVPGHNYPKPAPDPSRQCACGQPLVGYLSRRKGACPNCRRLQRQRTAYHRAERRAPRRNA